MARTASHEAATRPDDKGPTPVLRFHSDANGDPGTNTEDPAEIVAQGMLAVHLAAKAVGHALESKKERKRRHKLECLGVQLCERLLNTDDTEDQLRAVRILVQLQARHSELVTQRLELVKTALEAFTRIQCAQIRTRLKGRPTGEVAKRHSASRRVRSPL